jgi:hypothetical protein
LRKVVNSNAGFSALHHRREDSLRERNPGTPRFFMVSPQVLFRGQALLSSSSAEERV